MPRHLISDTHESVNEIPNAPIFDKMCVSTLESHS